MALIKKILSWKRKKVGNFRAISSTKHTCVPHNWQWQLAAFCPWHGTNPTLLNVFISEPACHLLRIFCISKSSQCFFYNFICPHHIMTNSTWLRHTGFIYRITINLAWFCRPVVLSCFFVAVGVWWLWKYNSKPPNHSSFAHKYSSSTCIEVNVIYGILLGV